MASGTYALFGSVVMVAVLVSGRRCMPLLFQVGAAENVWSPTLGNSPA